MSSIDDETMNPVGLIAWFAPTPNYTGASASKQVVPNLFAAAKNSNFLILI